MGRIILTAIDSYPSVDHRFPADSQVKMQKDCSNAFSHRMQSLGTQMQKSDDFRVTLYYTSYPYAVQGGWFESW
jgi:hypothetical protein